MSGQITTAVALVCALTASLTAHAATPKLLSPGTALYARVIRLPAETVVVKPHAIYFDDTELFAAVTQFNNGTNVGIYKQARGEAFSQLTEIHDPDFANGLCCGTIYRLPQAVGRLAKGSILWAGSVGQGETTNRQMMIKVYKSDDAGRTWSYLNEIVASNTSGLWEPDFSIAADGALVMVYSDETQAAWSQLLNEVRSYDGVTWQDPTHVAASSQFVDRPGMGIVSRLANGQRMMTFELCGPSNCAVHYKISADGWNWGDPTDLGTPIALPNGQTFWHTPYNTVLPDGSILLIGQIFVNADGSTADGNGAVMFKNDSGDPSQPWHLLAAPVAIPSPFNNYCPNYSSPLLASPNGTSVNELASEVSGTDCLMLYGKGPIQ